MRPEGVVCPNPELNTGVSPVLKECRDGLSTGKPAPVLDCPHCPGDLFFMSKPVDMEKVAMTAEFLTRAYSSSFTGQLQLKKYIFKLKIVLVLFTLQENYSFNLSSYT